ncbi:MAG: urea ABC transporter permease subunit UrtB [Rhodobiaceae bacterium]|nr:urea ABC transporter permease subunit UrtB [Rhodobiaceae bacterium]
MAIPSFLKTLLLGLLLALPLSAAHADDAQLREILSGFAQARNFNDVEKVIEALGKTGDSNAAPALRALSDGSLQVRAEDKSVVIVTRRGGREVMVDPLTDEIIAPTEGVSLDKIKIKNSIRRMINDALSGLTLRAENPNVRISAANTIFQNADESQLEAIESAIADEKNASVKARMEQARAAIVLKSSSDEKARIDAVDTIVSRGDRDALALLNGYVGQTEGALRQRIEAGIGSIQDVQAFWNMGQNVWYGISLGSVLFLAAIGLAITFGVMGVINMAHGEMVMLGAYTTFVVQQIMRDYAPDALDYSLAIALPAAFLVAGLAGLIIERGIIRFLYGRPLETLLATWGVSLILQQAVRTIFGPTNREVSNPSWMSGAFELGQLSITWNRMWIVVFAIGVFVVLLLVINRTRLGLFMRAVTQNRRMASAMGIRTPWVDALTFALGSGIAGIAGVALSQIDNVSPNLGQGYIIDSFMVVVFGGVGNLWGTLVGGLTLGIANKFLEPFAGAVFGKILVLIFIILFIQRRPRGLFAMRGRAVEQ